MVILVAYIRSFRVQIWIASRRKQLAEAAPVPAEELRQLTVRLFVVESYAPPARLERLLTLRHLLNMAVRVAYMGSLGLLTGLVALGLTLRYRRRSRRQRLRPDQPSSTLPHTRPGAVRTAPQSATLTHARYPSQEQGSSGGTRATRRAVRRNDNNLYYLMAAVVLLAFAQVSLPCKIEQVERYNALVFTQCRQAMVHITRGQFDFAIRKLRGELFRQSLLLLDQHIIFQIIDSSNMLGIYQNIH